VTVHRIVSADEARALAVRLQTPGRERPTVVLTIAGGQTEPFGDAEEIKKAVGDLADVVVMPTSDVSWAFSRAMPPDTQVYGGAGRVYPLDIEWAIRPYMSKLRFAYSAADRARITEHLTNDALAAAMSGDLLARRGTTSYRERSGVVALVVESRAVVKLDDGALASVWEELTEPGVPLDRLLTRGQQVTGVYDTGSGRLDLRGGLRRTGRLDYRAGDVVLADVAAVEADSVSLRLLPGASICVGRTAVTSNEDDLLTGLFTPGEVVACRIASVLPLALRLDDIDDDEVPLDAPSLLPGGPPWLRLPDLVTPIEPPTVVDEVPEAPVPSPAPVTPARPPTPLEAMSRVVPAAAQVGELLAERDRVTALATELDALRRHAAGLERERDQARRKVEQLQSRYRNAERARQKSARDLDAAPAFTDPAEQFRWDVHCEWVRRIPAAEKPFRQLKEFDIGPEFLASVERVEGVPRGKIASVVVEVLTGHAEHSAGRVPHQLRSGPAGSPYVTRPGGGTCWRVALHTNTPAARRLHYWRTGDRFELSRVVLHDDFRP
jgi:hypothetical protein